MRRLDPSFDGALPLASGQSPAFEVAGGVSAAAAPAPRQARPIPLTQVVRTAGSLDAEHVRHAAGLLQALPAQVREAAHEPSTARALVLGLLSDRRSAAREVQERALAAVGAPELLEDFARARSWLEQVPVEARLAVLDLAMPALRRLSPEQRQVFLRAVDALMRSDRKVTVFEYALHHCLKRSLAPYAKGRLLPEASEGPLRPLSLEYSVLLSALAHAGTRDPAQKERAFRAGADLLTGGARFTLLGPEATSLLSIDRALTRLSQTAPRLRRQLMEAVATVVTADGQVSVAEAELLRAVAHALECPVPPLLPGQGVVAAERSA
jgi:hypothetical protein